MASPLALPITFHPLRRAHSRFSPPCRCAKRTSGRGHAYEFGRTRPARGSVQLCTTRHGVREREWARLSDRKVISGKCERRSHVARLFCFRSQNRL